MSSPTSSQKPFNLADAIFDVYFSGQVSGLDYAAVPAKVGWQVLCATARIVRDFAIFAFKGIEAKLNKDYSKNIAAQTAYKTLENQAHSWIITCQISTLLCNILFKDKRKLSEIMSYGEFYADIIKHW